MFVLDYVSMLLATTLILMNRPWLVTWVSIGGVILDPLLNAVLVPRTLHWLGTGGGGVACAIAHLTTEGLTALAFVVLIGREALDRPVVSRVLRTLGVCAAVVVLDRLLPLPALGRLCVDGLGYVALAWLTGAITPSDVQPLLRAATSRTQAAVG
jgi:hypothetical protein